jgi:phosphopantothenoylcysteine decarboxylase/phosphopantothenate--cysteine ligase
MTPSACTFVGAPTFAALSGRTVLEDLWTVIDAPASQHVSLAREADAMLIAPCTMQTLASLAHGFASNAVTLLGAAVDRANTPVLVAPSMNEVMLNQPSVQRNIAQLIDDGFTVLAPGDGWQACRTQGAGRLPEPETLIAAIDAAMVAGVDSPATHRQSSGL